MFAGEPQQREALFGGVGRVSVWTVADVTAAPPFSAALGCELAPGASVGRHRQEHDAELIVALDGDGEVELDGAWRPLPVGAVAVLPLGAVLALRNRSASAPWRYLILKARGVSPR